MENALVGGGSGGYLHLDLPQNTIQSSNPITETPFSGSPTFNFKSASASGDTSIITMGLLALVAIFIVKELA